MFANGQNTHPKERESKGYTMGAREPSSRSAMMRTTRSPWSHVFHVHMEEMLGAQTVAHTHVGVPRPHGRNAGEKSVQTDIEQHREQYRFAILMDKHGRRSINRVFDADDSTTGRAVAPPFLLYLLLEKDECTVKEFCKACGEMLRGEGWTGYQAIQAAWEAIPVDCSEYLPSDLLR